MNTMLNPRSSAPLLGVVALLLGMTSGCATERYVGAIGRDRTFVNRGYGVLLRLGAARLESRWTAIEPDAPRLAPTELRPQRIDGPLDLDGDGRFSIHERARFMRPTLRLHSKTSSTAVLDLDVTIVGKEDAQAPLESILGAVLPKATETSTPSFERLRVKSGREALVLEFSGPSPEGGTMAYRVAALDHEVVAAEEGKKRRQCVRLELRAARLNDALRADFAHLLEALILADRADALLRGEEY